MVSIGRDSSDLLAKISTLIFNENAGKQMGNIDAGSSVQGGFQAGNEYNTDCSIRTLGKHTMVIAEHFASEDLASLTGSARQRLPPVSGPRPEQ